MSQIRYVFWASLWTAIACGLGAIPFIWAKSINKKWIWYANAVASSMMIAASFDLIYQGLEINSGDRHNVWSVIGWILIGLIFILITHHWADKHEQIKAHGHKMITWRNAFLIIVIMTMHSGAEWLAMWVAQWASQALGLFVIIVMAIQNIPEWLAISLQLVPNGTPRRRAALRSIATSLPQPLLAVPAFYFVETFKPIIPWWLGFAAGCMLRMCFGWIAADSYEWTDKTRVGIIATMSIVFMIILQVLVM